jgi:tRNA-modifying protein YgfZ
MEPEPVAVRGVVEVAGPEARALLQRLITNDVEKLAPGEARYAALLTPQGKIVVDFLAVSTPSLDQPERFLLDCPAHLAPALARKLTMYKLRAQVSVADLSGELGAVPLIEAIAPGDSGLTVYSDPRSAALGLRVIGPHSVIATLRGAAAEIEQRRIEAGVPEGGVDFQYEDAFPHEANLDRLNGVDFAKGCYVGQEVVSRMHHRGTTRKRVIGVSFEGPAPLPGTPITAGDVAIGSMGSSVPLRGLALVRTDRASEAVAPPRAGDTALRLMID